MGLESIEKFETLAKEANEIQFFFKLNGKTTVIRLNKTATILELKNKIQDQSGVSVSLLYCVVNGKSLGKDSDSIDKYISADSTVICNLKLKGGAFIPGVPIGKDDVSQAQNTVKDRLAKGIEKWGQVAKDQAIDIINLAKNDTLMYSEDSLAFYLKKGKDTYMHNNELIIFFNGMNDIAKKLNQLNKTVETNKETKKKNEEEENKMKGEIIKDINTIHKECGSKVDRLNNDKKITKEEKKYLEIYKDTLSVLEKCCHFEEGTPLPYVQNVLNAFKSCPYYTLYTPDLILCKSRDLPLGEVYIEPIEGGEKIPKDLKSLMKSFYQKIYSDMNMLSKQIKTVGLCNTYYLTALKEQHKEGKNKEEIKNIIASLGLTTSTYTNNIPFEGYEKLKKPEQKDFFGERFITLLEGLDDLDLNLIGNPGEYEYRDQAIEADNKPNLMHQEYSYAQEVTFASIATAAKNLPTILNSIKQVLKNDEPYWANQIGNMKGIIETVCRLRGEFKNRMDFANGLLGEFIKVDRTKIISPIELLDLGFSSFKAKALPYLSLQNDIKVGVIHELVDWSITFGEEKYEVNPLKIDETEVEISNEIENKLQKKGNTFSLKGETLFEINKNTRDQFVKNCIENVWLSLKEKLEQAARGKKDQFGLFKVLGCAPAIKYAESVTKSKQDPVRLGINLFKANIEDTSNFYKKYIEKAGVRIKALQITTDNISMMREWVTEGKDNLKIKKMPIYTNLIEEETTITANLLEEANSYYDLSDRLRVMELESRKINKIMDGDIKTEKYKGKLETGQKWVKASTDILGAVLGIAAGVTAAAFPPVAPLLALIAGGVKLVGAVIGKVLENEQQKAEDKLNLLPFMAVINDFMKIIISFQEGINKYTAMIFEFCRLKSALR